MGFDAQFYFNVLCKIAVFPILQLSPLPKIGEGFGEWSEAPSYEEGVGVDGSMQGNPAL